jgi:2-polyprenyl-3-methyl-5-hydroxy-6-metoxy-1,4-benzoquinol methylase
MFRDRKLCPICGTENFNVYLDLPYGEGKVGDFLYTYYKLEQLMTRQTFQKRFSDARYRLAECNEFSCAFQIAVPDTSLAAEIYGTWVDFNNASENALLDLDLYSSQHCYSEALKICNLVQVAGTGKRLGEQKILDFGMGHGSFALALKACFVQTYGFDFAEDRQQHGASLGIKMVKGEEISKQGGFDFINTEQVFEHLPNPLDTAKVLASALLPGGILKISVPYSRSMESHDFQIDWSASRYARQSPTPLHPIEHLQYYRRPSLLNMAARLGLQKIEMPRSFHIKFGLNWFGRGGPRNLARVIAIAGNDNFNWSRNCRMQFELYGILFVMHITL